MNYAITNELCKWLIIYTKNEVYYISSLLDKSDQTVSSDESESSGGVFSISSVIAIDFLERAAQC